MVLSDGLSARLLGRRRRLRVGLRVLAAEPLYAACCVNQPLLAGEERVASRADFHVYVALMGRTSLKVVSARAQNPHRGIVRVNLFLGHLRNLSCNHSIVW